MKGKKKRKTVNRNVKKKENFWKKHYSLSWDYIKESKGYIQFIIFIFVLASFVALFWQPPFIVDWIRTFVEQLLQKTEGLSTGELIIFISNNNLKGSFIAMMVGMVFGIFPLVMGLMNGYLLGFVAEKSVQVEGISILWRLVPHGIFELPAIVISLALGIKLGMFWFTGSIKKEFLRRFENSLRVFLFVILPLLIIAAIIEGILIGIVG